MPVLPRHRGAVELRRNSSHQNLHELPRAALDQRATAEPVRQSWATGEPIAWTRVHDLPDFVYFDHSIHANKGLAARAAHAGWDQMPLMYAQNTLQMECVWTATATRQSTCGRPARLYMAWEAPSERGRCGARRACERGVPTAQSVDCVAKEPVVENSFGAEGAPVYRKVEPARTSWAISSSISTRFALQRTDQLRGLPPMTDTKEEGNKNARRGAGQADLQCWSPIPVSRAASFEADGRLDGAGWSGWLQPASPTSRFTLT